MAKVAFSKLKLSKKDDVKTVTVNDIEIEVKQYLPIEDKIDVVTNVLTSSIDTNNFANPMKVELFTTLEIIYAYTNLTFTDKQREDVTKLYDLLEANDVVNTIVSAIPESEYYTMIDFVGTTIESYHRYKNSALGIFDSISNDYSQMKLDTEELQQNISNPENLTLLKDVMDKLG